MTDTSATSARPDAAPDRPAPEGRARWELPRLDPDDRIVGGLSVGIAREIGIDALWVRLAFVALFGFGGWGALLYLMGWGAVAAIDYGRPPGPSRLARPKGSSSLDRHLGFALVVLGIAIAVSRLVIVPDHIVWPCAVVGLGVVVARRPLGRGGDRHRLAPLEVLVGLAVIVLGFGLLVSRVVGEGTALEVTLGIGLVGLLVAAASAPWWWGMVRSLDAERQARVRSDERAEVAAHLHDSVLQTLALIQKADDPNDMVRLARRQERELRNWLDPERVSRRGGSLRGRLDELVGACEDEWGIRVETVVVGDCLVDERIEAALGATREAIVNAAKHAGVDKVDLYAEVLDERVEVFVRDAGSGFDPTAVAEDRRGLAHSIRGRLERAGGRAEVFTAPGEGTEIELVVPRDPDTTGRPSATDESESP